MKTFMMTGILKALAISALLALPAVADEARVKTYKSQLQTVRPPELPGQTARLVSDAKADAGDAVRAAVSVNAASAPLVVGSVAKSSPSSAAAAAAAAIALQPKLSGAISKAAVSAAPAEIISIVTASCKARPVSFYSIGVGAAEAAPRSSDRIIPAITAAVPGLKPLIERAQKDFKVANRTASLALVLKHTENILAALSSSENVSPETLLAANTDSTVAVKLASLAGTPPPPVQRPPFVPGGTPGEVPASGTPEISPNDRDYSAP
jgi:hypothetical protein